MTGEWSLGQTDGSLALPPIDFPNGGVKKRQVPHARVATPFLTSRTTTSSTPIPRTPDKAFTPVRGGRIGTLMSGVSFSDKFEGGAYWRCFDALLLGTRWHLRASERKTKAEIYRIQLNRGRYRRLSPL